MIFYNGKKEIIWTSVIQSVIRLGFEINALKMQYRQTRKHCNIQKLTSEQKVLPNFIQFVYILAESSP